MTRRPNSGRKKADGVPKPSKRIIFFTARSKDMKKDSTDVLLAMVDWAMDKNWLILTTDDDADVIRRANSRKYEKVIVWGCGGNIKHATNFGHNHLAMYAAPQRDDVCVARSGTFVAVGGGKRIGKLATFAKNLSHHVVMK